MAAARNAARKGRQRSPDPAESLINLSNERLTGLFRWTLLIFAVILNNLNAAPGYDEGRVNGILAAWGVVCLSTLLLLFLQFHLVQARAQHPHRLGAILDLGLLILAGDHHSRRQMCDANRRIGRVYGLAARSG